MKQNKFLVGIDEVGRGPIAGPVAVGALVFSEPEARKSFRGVKESKQLSEEKREEWFAKIEKAKKAGIIDFSVSFESHRVIDSKGIVFAINKALRNSLYKLKLIPNKTRVLLDGGLRAPVSFKEQKTIIKGDEKEIVIALASICAKVSRDRYMRKIDKKYPEYDFKQNKGYGTKKHYEAVKEYGITPIHRRTFLKVDRRTNLGYP